MCTQRYHVYQCGCRTKGEFIQCDRLYERQSNLQCNITLADELTSRNYCPKHLPKESKATTEYRGRYAH